MNIEEFAQLLNAKKVSRRKWMALCPAHPDRSRSLSIDPGRKHAVVLQCRSQGCSAESILRAMGLKWRDLLGEGVVAPEARRKITDGQELDRLTGRFCVALWLESEARNRGNVDDQKHWHAAAKRIGTVRRAHRQKTFDWNRAADEFERQVKREREEAIWEETHGAIGAVRGP